MLSSPRGIDHLVLPVRDLDGAAARYAAMGFQVGARNRHPWGTENRLVQFPGAFLELITLGDGGLVDEAWAARSRFATFSRDYLARNGDGFAMLVAESKDAATDKTAFDAAGIGGFETFFFERFGKRPDGAEVRVAFTLAFAADAASPDASFFVCQQHEPQNFWNPTFQEHANGVAGLAGVVLLAKAPAEHRRFLAGFSGIEPAEAEGGALVARTPRGDISIVTPAAFTAVYGDAAPMTGLRGMRLAAFRCAGNRSRAAAALVAGGVPFTPAAAGLVVAAENAAGTAIIFE